MLKKVLKYDLKYVFKYWWIGAVVCFALAIVGGFGIKIEEMSYVKELPVAVELFAGLATVLSVLGFFAFSMFAEVLVIIRMYKNFYTDEGYLTFTLPAKRSTLLASKLLTGYITTVVTILTSAINLFVMICIPFYKDIFSWETYIEIRDAVQELVKELGVKYIVIYLIELLAIIALVILFSMLVIFVCMSIGSLIAKKGKILASFALYYAFTNVGTSVLFIYMTVVATPLASWFMDMNEGQMKLVFALIFGLALCFILMLNAILYTIQYRLLDKKLNLQ